MRSTREERRREPLRPRASKGGRPTAKEGPTAKSPRRREGKNPRLAIARQVLSGSETASRRARGTIRDAMEGRDSRHIANLCLDRNRPSTGRGLGSDPGPPCAFEVSMIKVSCNSH